jgi:hypothetical protein
MSDGQHHHHSYADLMLAIIECFWKWESHTTTCDQCAHFAVLPIKSATLNPCENGQRLIQSLIAVLKHGL